MNHKVIDLDAPWLPEGARVPQPGDRVRVRLSGECRVRFALRDGAGEPQGSQAGHFAVEDGKTGVVMRMIDYPHHQYVVALDVPTVCAGMMIESIGYCAHELELLDVGDHRAVAAVLDDER